MLLWGQHLKNERSALFELAPPVDSENLKKMRALDFNSEFLNSEL